MSLYIVPRGKTIRITLGTNPINENIPMVLEEEIQITLSSKFAPLMTSGEQKFLTILNQLSGELQDTLGFVIPAGFKEMGFQLWGGTDPIAFSPTVAFYMKTNAFKDVIEPTLKLMALPLPDDVEIIEGQGFKGLMAPGPSISTMFGNDGGNTGKNISVEIGEILRISKAIVKKAEPVFASEVDENGYPIWAKVRLDINSSYTATTNMIYEFVQSKEPKVSR